MRQSVRADGAMTLERSSGILLHLSSLPVPHGIGDLGAEAVAFLDYLVDAKQTWWQMLPVGPVGAGNSPYQSASSFAGNPLFLSLDGLLSNGLLEKRDLRNAPNVPEEKVDYPSVFEFR